MNLFEYNFVSIHGANLPMRTYQGQPVLLVNTASKCGYTPQYANLQKLWEDYRQSGLVVIGVPCNDFGEQEPAEEDIIAQFCESNYRISFPMTRKEKVLGREAHPVYLSIQEELGSEALPKWNFHKYLFNTYGDLVDGWPAAVEPGDPVITHQIERHLQSWIL